MSDKELCQGRDGKPELGCGKHWKNCICTRDELTGEIYNHANDYGLTKAEVWGKGNYHDPDER